MGQAHRRPVGCKRGRSFARAARDMLAMSSWARSNASPRRMRRRDARSESPARERSPPPRCHARPCPRWQTGRCPRARRRSRGHGCRGRTWARKKATPSVVLASSSLYTANSAPPLGIVKPMLWEFGSDFHDVSYQSFHLRCASPSRHRVMPVQAEKASGPVEEKGERGKGK